MRLTPAGALGGALIVVAALALSGCSETPASSLAATTAPSPAAGAAAAAHPCQDAATSLVGAVGQAVASYDTPTAAAAPGPAATASATSGAPPTTATRPSASASASPDGSGDLTGAVVAARSSITRYGCSTTTFTTDLDRGLATVETHTPIAKAVLTRLGSALTGRIPQTVETRHVTPTEDLAAAMAAVAPGSTLELEAGRYAISSSLVVLEAVTLHGAGKDQTVIASSAPDAAVVVMSAGQVELSGLRLELTPSVPASGIVAGPASSLKLSGIRVSGATATPAGLGGAGVQMSGRDTEGAGRGTTLEATDSEFDHNAWAGIALGGGHRASILRGGFTGNGQCGVCFLDATTGSVQNSHFADDPVALGANGSARPTWVGNTVTGGTVGVQLDGTAAPTISTLTVTGASRAAMIFSGRSGGSVSAVSCVSVPYGIVVADTAAPTLGETSCTVARGG